MTRTWIAVAALAAGTLARAGEGEGAAAPKPLDLVQRELARQGQVVQALREVVEGLDAVAEHDAAAVLLAHEGDSAERLRSALEAAQERKRREAGRPVPPVAAPARTAEPGPAVAEAPAAERRRREPPLETISSAQILYAQAGDAEHRRGGTAVLRPRTRELDLAEGQTVTDGEDRIRLVGVHEREDGKLRLELEVNGSAVTVGYPAVSM